MCLCGFTVGALVFSHSSKDTYHPPNKPSSSLGIINQGYIIGSHPGERLANEKEPLRLKKEVKSGSISPFASLAKLSLQPSGKKTRFCWF